MRTTLLSFLCVTELVPVFAPWHLSITMAVMTLIRFCGLDHIIHICVFCVDRQVIQHFDSKSEHFIGGSNGNQRDIKLTNKLSIDDLSLKAAQVFVASQYTLFNMSWCFYPFDSSTPHSYSFA